MDNDKFYKVYDAYTDIFENAFPRMEYVGYTNEEQYDMMRECIAQNKPCEELYPVDKSEVLI